MTSITVIATGETSLDDNTVLVDYDELKNVLAGRATLKAEIDKLEKKNREACEQISESSRICERGIIGCIVYHDEQ